MTGPFGVMPKHSRLVLWFAPEHSGKTAAALRLAQLARGRGFDVAGLLAPSVYVDGRLAGFEALDLRSGKKVGLAKRVPGASGPGRFAFTAEGVGFARAALDPASVESADLVVVDEFGPLEMAGGGWRRELDSLLAATDVPILLVVRRELLDRAQRLYAGVPIARLPAVDPASADKVIAMLARNRGGGP
jgi:nucleoside-triphosphatase THEP1